MEESTMVLESAKPHLEALAKAAKKLNEASDQYTAELRTIETEVNALNLGFEVTLLAPLRVSATKEAETDSDFVSSYQIAQYLGYGRVSRERWGVVVHTDNEFLDDHGQIERTTRESTVPLFECSRDIRIASADHILDLLYDLEKEAQRRITGIENVMDRRNA